MPESNQQLPEIPTSKLFVYGIFLGATMRSYYEMHNPMYATVPGFLTVGQHIVQARYEPTYPNLALTGLLVEIPDDRFESLDALEGGYERVRVTTDSGEAFMYVEVGTADLLNQIDQNTTSNSRRYTSERVM